MVLCLSNGERIKLHPKMRILFEVADLAVASPATVSRCGMVFVDDSVITYNEIIASYFTKLSAIDSVKSIFLNQFENLLDKLYPTLTKLKAPIHVSNT